MGNKKIIAAVVIRDKIESPPAINNITDDRLITPTTVNAKDTTIKTQNNVIIEHANGCVLQK